MAVVPEEASEMSSAVPRWAVELPVISGRVLLLPNERWKCRLRLRWILRRKYTSIKE